MRSRGEAGKVLRGNEWQAGDHRLWQCRRGRSTRAAQHRREQAVPRAPPQALGFAGVKATTWLVAKSSRVGCCASAVRGVSSPRPCFGARERRTRVRRCSRRTRNPTHSEAPPDRTCGASRHTPLSQTSHRVLAHTGCGPLGALISVGKSRPDEEEEVQDVPVAWAHVAVEIPTPYQRSSGSGRPLRPHRGVASRTNAASADRVREESQR